MFYIIPPLPLPFTPKRLSTYSPTITITINPAKLANTPNPVLNVDAAEDTDVSALYV